MKAEFPRVTLVLADDHRAFASTTDRLLREEFEILEVVHDGEAALDAVQRLDPDLLVLDLSMPRRTGVEVMRSLRSRGARTGIVILTFFRDASMADRLFEHGALAYVVKAHMVADLPPAIRAAASGRQFCSDL